MRILIDTNVLIAAFITPGVCAELFWHCARYHTLISSEYILGEVEDKLTSKFKYSKLETAQVVDLIRSRVTLQVPLNVPFTTCQDQEDLPILGSAEAGACRCILTGDKDLLSIKRYRNIDIISPNDFWKYEES